MCNKSESIMNLAKALVAFNTEVKIIEKDATNPHFKNAYASLDTIVNEVRPLLARHGLSLMQFPGGDGEKFTLRSMLLHESGEWIESEPITMRPVKNDPQGIGSCSTYARRYSLSAMLSLNTGEDDDGNAATQPQTRTEQPKQSQQNELLETKAENNPSANLISEAQANYAQKLKKEKRINDEDFRRMVAEYSKGNMDVYQINKSQASKFINFLNNYGAAGV